jgi:hypothetical protein
VTYLGIYEMWRPPRFFGGEKPFTRRRRVLSACEVLNEH